MHEPIVRRYEGNPIITADDIHYPVVTVHNAGVTKHDGKYYMLFRSHRTNGRSILGLAVIDDGYRFVPRGERHLRDAQDGA